MPLNKEEIVKHLNNIAKKNIHAIQIEQSITSTNEVLSDTIKLNPTQNKALLAEEQTAGKGRLGRPWASPSHKNIYLSLSWYFEKPAAAIAGLSITIGECVISALKAYGIKADITLKWPNDLLHQNQKFCGILIETLPINQVHTVAIIGIGININYDKEENQIIDQPWTSLKEITGRTHDRNVITAHLLNTLSETLTQIAQKNKP